MDSGAPTARVGSSWAAFLRLWFVLFFSYAGVRLLFNMAVLGWIDLRPVAFLDLLVLPLGQSIVFWIVTRQRRARAPMGGSAAAVVDRTDQNRGKDW